MPNLLNISLRWILITALFAVANAAPSAVYRQWTIGQEREVDEGVYAKIIYQQNGWRVWRFEKKDGVTCKAVKSARGKANPIPLGFKDTLFDGTPFISVSRGYKNAPSVDLHGEHGYGRDWRGLGEKFWQEELNYSDLAEREGKLIEVHVETWEYPELYVGRVDEKAIMDLTGFSSVVDALVRCDPTIILPRTRKLGDASVEAWRALPSQADIPMGVKFPDDELSVEYRVVISPAGKPLQCSVPNPSGIEVMDLKTCEIVIARANFHPAQDSGGHPTEGIFFGTITWRQ